jgi:succinyl-CoA synthetase alpha subunit
MSILIDSNTRVLVQGITGRQGGFHATQMIEYGTNVVAGATPGRGGAMFQGKVPVFDSVSTAVNETAANTSIIFVPAPGATDAILEAADGGISLILCITEGVPALDMVTTAKYLKEKGVRLIGPNCPGAISPSHLCRVGIMPSDIHMPGHVGVVSRSGTLTYEAVHQLTQLGIGQSTCVGIGGDPLTGSSFVDILALFEEDPDTSAVVLIGEIGGAREQIAAEFIKEGGFTKPLVAMIAGQTAPHGKRMGHAGAVITGSAALATSKVQALSEAGAIIAPSPAHIGTTVQNVLGKS